MKVLILALGLLSNLGVAEPKTDYMLNCQGCHLADGSGLKHEVPNMKNVVGKFLQVEGGRDFLVQVPGSANSPLSNKRLADLLNWILITMSSEQLGDNFVPYTELEVKRTRSKILLNVSEVREKLVANF